MRAVGSSISRVDAKDKVTGAALYPGDIERPGMLWLKTLFAERPHARVRSIDTRAAEAAPGVLGVFTAADVPFNGYGLNVVDQPVLCGPGAPDGVPDADRVRWPGDQVAVVVAETEAQAAAALAADPGRLGGPAPGGGRGGRPPARRAAAASQPSAATSCWSTTSAAATSRPASPRPT